MRKIYLLAALAAALFAGSACQKTTQPTTNEEGTLILSVAPEKLTKAVTAYSEATGNEATVTDIQIFVFDASGNLVKYLSNGTTTTASISVVAGTYDVYAVVNGPSLSSVTTKSGLTGTAIALADYNATGSDFVMAGNASATVTANNTSAASVTVKRFVSRVALQKVTNNTPYAMTINSVFLSNVVTNQTIEGSDAPSTFINQYGRQTSHTGTKITTTSDLNDLTLKTCGSAAANGGTYTTRQLMYAYSNSTNNDQVTGLTTWTATATRLVVYASYNGGNYYYPVVIDKGAFGRNKAYTVEMSISGPGLDDPQGDPNDLAKGTISVTVTVGGWDSGAEYEPEY